jgi:hypothetical protein
MEVKQIQFKSVRWIHLALVKVQKWVLVRTLMNLQILQETCYPLKTESASGCYAR